VDHAPDVAEQHVVAAGEVEEALKLSDHRAA
jgi:hypothetical protein